MFLSAETKESLWGDEFSSITPLEHIYLNILKIEKANWNIHVLNRWSCYIGGKTQHFGSAYLLLRFLWDVRC
jgi:hypothetical protein